jgi:hypothetical protein
VGPSQRLAGISQKPDAPVSWLGPLSLLSVAQCYPSVATETTEATRSRPRQCFQGGVTRHILTLTPGALEKAPDQHPAVPPVKVRPARGLPDEADSPGATTPSSCAITVCWAACHPGAASRLAIRAALAGGLSALPAAILTCGWWSASVSVTAPFGTELTLLAAHGSRSGCPHSQHCCGSIECRFSPACPETLEAAPGAYYSTRRTQPGSLG